MNNQNLIYDIKDITTESGLPEEPVTLQEMKDYLRLEGFVDEEESTTESLSDFAFDDTLINTMISAARQKIEKYCGVSVVFHTWKVLLTNNAGDIELPYGPVQTFTSLTDKNGTAYGESVIVTRGFDFLHLEEPMSDKMTAIYDAGYEDCPDEIRLGIMQQVADWYENRIIGVLGARAKHTVSPFKRAWTWLA